MAAEDDSLSNALLEALLTGRPIAMYESGRPDLAEVGFGLEVEERPEEAS
jgi:hypothetical protein